MQWERCARLAADADLDKIETWASSSVAGEAGRGRDRRRRTAEATRRYGSAVVRRAVHVLIAIATIEVAVTLLLLPWSWGDYYREHG